MLPVLMSRPEKKPKQPEEEAKSINIEHEDFESLEMYQHSELFGLFGADEMKKEVAAN
jgi:hypothetical protein